MKVGIVADTHDHLDAIRRAVEIFNDEGIELLIHAGDFVAPFTEQPFRMLNAPLVGIFGNNDGDKLLLKEKYRENGVGELYEDPHEFELVTKRIIVTHRPKIVKALGASGVYDVIIYGHTHKAEIKHESTNSRDQGERTWTINPGECCGYITKRKTVALLDLEKEEARIVEL